MALPKECLVEALLRGELLLAACEAQGLLRQLWRVTLRGAMQEARAFHCSVCGGPTEADARRCEYCRSALATLRCAACFHMNGADARHCGGCGFELGLEPVPAPSEVRCPTCSLVMTALTEPAGNLFDCEGCGGQFLEHALLSTLIEREQRRELGVTGAPLPPPPRNSTRNPVQYRSCPVCTSLMLRKNFGVQSGIVVDVCARHGSFFDAGELPEVLRFVARGGLERARRQLEQTRSGPGSWPALPSFAGDQSPLDIELSKLLKFFERLLRRS